MSEDVLNLLAVHKVTSHLVFGWVPAHVTLMLPVTESVPATLIFVFVLLPRPLVTFKLRLFAM